MKNGFRVLDSDLQLNRLRHVGRVSVTGPQDPAVPRNLGFESAASVEEALAQADAHHGRGCRSRASSSLRLPRRSWDS